MRTIDMTCPKCNGTMVLNGQGDYAFLTCPYCGTLPRTLVESDRIKRARIEAQMEETYLAYRYMDRQDRIMERRTDRRIQLRIICAVAVTALVMIVIFFSQG